MRIALERRRPARTRPELVEIVTPRTNAAIITPVENLLAAVSVREPFGLEIAATSEARWLLARTPSPETQRHLTAQLAAAYPQAELRRLDLGQFPALDPARPGPHEQAAAVALVPARPPYLPLRTFRDVEVDAARDAQADPLLGILGALADLPPGWRALSQLVLWPAPGDWGAGYLRLALEDPLARERQGAGTSLTSVFALAGLLAAGALVFQGYTLYQEGAWLGLVALVGGVLGGIPLLIWLARRWSRRPLHDPRLVREKLGRRAYRAELRLAVFAPADVPSAAVAAKAEQLAAAYGQFDLPAGNCLIPRRLDLRGRDLGALLPLLPGRSRAILNTRELAGLWHLPQAAADVPLLERTAARVRLPLPVAVAAGCRIGRAIQQGREVPVALPDDLLRRHLLLVAKTRRGKSSLMLRLARHLMDEPNGSLDGAGRSAVVLVDPHRDLARAALGLVPERRRADVVFLDVGHADRPFGLNLLDVGLGWDRDRAVANLLAIFRREFDRFWGPRMEDAFRFAALTLYAANEKVCAAVEDGRARQHTILDVPALFVDVAFRRQVLGLVADPVIRAWWSDYFEPLDRRLALEIVNPVATKIQRFAGSQAARRIVGQPRSTIDARAWVRDGAVVLVDTAKGVVGEDTSSLVGATLLNLLALVIGEQATLAPAERRHVSLLVDEFHAMAGADYEGLLSELSKYGASLVLATQSLARLESLDREQHRALRATVFANLDGLFAFNVSAEDARYLVHELGSEVDEGDLVTLGEHRCYARISSRGERLPTFSVRLDPPPSPDAGLADALAAASAQRYGRDRDEVDIDLAAARERIERSRRPPLDGTPRPEGENGVAVDFAPGPEPSDGRASRGKRRRNEHRRPGGKRSEGHEAPAETGTRDEDGRAEPADGGAR